MRQARYAFKGPMMCVVGPIDCGKNPDLPVGVRDQMGIRQYKDGKWVSIADGLTASRSTRRLRLAEPTGE